MTIKKMLLSSEEAQVVGQAVLTTTQSWVVPNNVFSISVVAFDPGSNGSSGATGLTAPGGAGGAGGQSRYVNDVAVTPGQTISVTISSTDAIFGSIVSGKSGGTPGAKGTTGAVGSSAGGQIGGAGGASGLAVSITNITLNPPGFNYGDGGRANNGGGAGGAGVFPGGGGGGGGGGASPGAGGAGGAGAIYIVWPGKERQFPNTRTGLEISGEISWQLLPAVDGSALSSSIANDGAGVWIYFPAENANYHYRSTDNGRAFTKITRAASRQINGLVCVGGVFLAITNNNGVVMRSTDGGQNWSDVSVASASAIGTNGSRVFIGRDSATGIYYSDNLGLTWTKATASGWAGLPRSIACGAGQCWMANPDSNAYRSVNDGISWSSVSGNINYKSIVFFEDIFIAIKGAGSTIGKGSGATLSESLGPAGDNAEVSVGPARVFLSGVSKFLQSFDKATTWVEPPTMANNLSGASHIMGKVIGDGFGAYICVGLSGFMMRGELK